MQNIIHITPLTVDQYDSYIEVGIKAYNQHYTHLWPNDDSTPYIESSFTTEVLQKEEQDKNTMLFLIYSQQRAVGIMKITKDSTLGTVPAEEALLVDKIYLLNEYSGKGIGKKVIQFALLRAKELNKKIVWLDTMRKGPALQFYLKNGFKIHSETKVHFTTAIEEERPMYIMVKELGVRS